MAEHGALATINTDELIDRIANGAYQSHLARELGVAPPSLHAKLSKHPGYRQALELRNMAKLDSSQENIENADEAFLLSRARESFRAAAWRAERECPQIWGNQVAVTGADGGPVQHQMSVQVVFVEPGRVIDQESDGSA